MSNFSKARDIFSLNTPSFENKLFYCRFVSKYHDDYEMAAGYEDGAEACLNNLSRDKLEALYVLSTASEDSNTEYEKGYRSAIKDYLLELRMKLESYMKLQMGTVNNIGEAYLEDMRDR